MPSTSPKQHRFMEAVAHDPGFAQKAGVPQRVGKDFAAADRGRTSFGTPKKKHSPQSVEDHMGKRRASGHTLRGVASEFGSSKSTVQRKTAAASPLATGFTKLGSAAVKDRGKSKFGGGMMRY